MDAVVHASSRASRTLVAALALLLAAACARGGPRAPAPAPVPPPDAAEEEVYRAVIDSVYVRSTGQRIAVVRQTLDTACTEFVRSLCGSASDRMGLREEWWKDEAASPAWAGMRDDLLRKSAAAAPLSVAFGHEAGVVAIDPAALDFTLADERPWPEFRERYGGAAGFVRFSRVGFAPDRSRALVSVQWECGPTCGHRLALSLERRAGGAWAIGEMFLMNSRAPVSSGQ
ncbi:MAG TPA: hypothetical protein VFX50_14505 [Gemmatimonadales bacterium]|nr:hypothetical protein [Gemmatimonadales bacterium]